MDFWRMVNGKHFRDQHMEKVSSKKLRVSPSISFNQSLKPGSSYPFLDASSFLSTSKPPSFFIFINKK